MVSTFGVVSIRNAPLSSRYTPLFLFFQLSFFLFDTNRFKFLELSNPFFLNLILPLYVNRCSPIRSDRSGATSVTRKEGDQPCIEFRTSYNTLYPTCLIFLENEILHIYSIYFKKKLLNEDFPSIVTSLYFNLRYRSWEFYTLFSKSFVYHEIISMTVVL